MPSDTPVLFVVFNRPKPTQRVFEAIRKARPTQLYVAVDGPRAHIDSDQANCQQVKEIVTKVDWDCQVHTLFREENLGCKLAVSGAITWFFEQVEEGIILEDDCLPSPSFFPYCAAVLEHYRHDAHVTHVNGTNFNAQKTLDTPYSYHFVHYQQIWGWATWRDAWQRFDAKLSLLPKFNDPSFYQHLGINQKEFARLQTKWWRIYNGATPTIWGYQWQFINLLEGRLAAAPKKNLISNIGFEREATHTATSDPLRSNLPTYELDLPVVHPPCVFVDSLLDNFYKPMMTRERLSTRIRRKLTSLNF